MPDADTYLYGKGLLNLLGGEIAGDTFAVDWLSDTLKMALGTGAVALSDLDTDEAYADWSAAEVANGNGYTTGGYELANKTISYVPAASATAWATGTAYKVGDIVRKISSNGHIYRCVVAGTSHASDEPTWPTGMGLTVTDNTVTWAEAGRGYTAIGNSVNPNWPNSTISATHAVVYKSGGGNPLIALIDFNGTIATTNGTFTVTLRNGVVWHFATR